MALLKICCREKTLYTIDRHQILAIALITLTPEGPRMTTKSRISRFRFEIFVGLLSIYQFIFFITLLIDENFREINSIDQKYWLLTGLTASVLTGLKKTRGIVSIIFGLICLVCGVYADFLGKSGLFYFGWMNLIAGFITKFNQGKNHENWEFPEYIHWLNWLTIICFTVVEECFNSGSEILLTVINIGLMIFLMRAKKYHLFIWATLLIFPFLKASYIYQELGFFEWLLFLLLIADERSIKEKGNFGILLFDGVCILCHRCIDLLTETADPAFLKISPLQGEFAKSVEGLSDQNPDSVILYTKNMTYFKSDAVIESGRRAGGFLRLIMEVVAIVPQPIRNFLYDKIAKYRYQIFGEKMQCELISKKKRLFFIP